MKQINECLDRYFEDKNPLSKKWRAVKDPGGNLWLFHYHHLILVFSTSSEEILYEWWQKPADKRGLEAAKLYLMKRFNLDIRRSV